MLLPAEDYHPSGLFKNPHMNTIAPTLLRKVNGVRYQRQRLELKDGDFLDLDFSEKGSRTVVLIIHGLEGNSQRPYMLGMAKMANDMGWDAVAMNQRGCSGHNNRLQEAYHSGKSEDIQSVLAHLESVGYEQVAVVGFSLGGNMTLKYVGERSERISPVIKGAVGISVPCHLEGSADRLKQRQNWIYLTRFLKTLKQKAVLKKEQFPEAPFSKKEIGQCKSFHDFDEVFTARINGFESAVDYWTKCSSGQFINDVKIPTLLINALDDPFLDARCFPTQIAAQHEWFHLMTPKRGGHVGFCRGFNMNEAFWTEKKVGAFLSECLV